MDKTFHSITGLPLTKRTITNGKFGNVMLRDANGVEFTYPLGQELDMWNGRTPRFLVDIATVVYKTYGLADSYNKYIGSVKTLKFDVTEWSRKTIHSRWKEVESYRYTATKALLVKIDVGQLLETPFLDLEIVFHFKDVRVSPL